jgi:O-antigen/teichoic acid export membrane protein
MTIVRDSALTFFTRIAFFILQGITASLLARSLGPEGRGLYSLIVMLPHIAALICNLGFSVSCTYFISSGLLSKNRVLALIVIFPIITGGIMMIPLIIFAQTYVDLYPEIPVFLFRVALLLIPFIALFNNSLAFLQGEKRFRTYNFTNISNPIIFLICFILFVIGLKMGISGAIISWQIGFILAFLIGLFFILQSNVFTLNFSVSEFKKMTKYGSKVASAELLTFLNYRVDIFLVGYFLSVKAVGFYIVAVVIAETLWFLASSISNVMLPNLAERDLKQAQVLLAKAFGIVLWATIFMLLFLLLFDRFLLNIVFGDEFAQSLDPLRYLYPGVLLLSVLKVLSSYILARGKPNVNMWIAFWGLLVNVFLNILLIPRLGIEGAAISSSFAYGLMFFGAFVWFFRQNQIPFTQYILIRKEELNIMLGRIFKLSVRI